MAPACLRKSEGKGGEIGFKWPVNAWQKPVENSVLHGAREVCLRYIYGAAAEVAVLGGAAGCGIMHLVQYVDLDIGGNWPSRLRD